MLIAIIVAMSHNRGIGIENKLPWRLPADQQLFKQTTLGHHVIMGRKTYQSIGRALPGRTNIVVSRNLQYNAPGCLLVHSLPAALDIARRNGETEAFVIGGSALYAQALPLADRLYLTIVHATVQADVFFPEFDETAWKTSVIREFSADEQNPFAFTFKILERA